MIAQLVVLAPVAVGAAYSIIAAVLAILWMRLPRRPPPPHLPPVTVLKPLYGADKNLRENLRSICVQDYPDYQVVLAIQRLNDPAIPIARAIAAEFGPSRVSLAIADAPPRLNGKAENLARAMALARHDTIVISDSDVKTAPHYLRTVVPPLLDPDVGAVCTLCRAAMADNVYEKLELLTLNCDTIPFVILAVTFRLARFCLGASTAIRRATLDRIGGFAALAGYMAEDVEMGRRIAAAGRRLVFLPHVVETMVDLPDVRSWWNHQVYWDQNARVASLPGFIALLFVKSVPFAIVFAAMRALDAVGLEILTAALALRIASAATILAFCAGDREGLRALWLLPLRDVAGLACWIGGVAKRDFVRRGVKRDLAPDGRIVADGR